jgi:UDP-glucose 4-epimerase
MKKTALVTGGAGFIGSHLVELLIKKKFKVIVLDNLSNSDGSNIKKFILEKKIIFLKKDILNKKINFRKFKLDYVFHLAALGSIVPSIDNPIKYIENNFNGTLNLLEKLRKIKIKKIVYAASSSCYGIAKTPTKEDSPINTEHPYAFSKWIAEEAIRHWSKLFNIPFISIRIFNAYGPRFQTQGAYGSVIGVFLKQKISKKPLTVVGSGSQSRDYVHAKDVANAFYLAAISNQKNEIFNLGSGKPIKINEIVKLINPTKIEKIPNRPGEPHITHANITKITKILNWKPKISFNYGFNDLLLNIKEWKTAPLWDKKKILKATKNWFKYLK